MKTIGFLTFSLILLPVIAYSQASTEQDMESAFQNAKKGIYWALSNIPVKKSKLENDLIAEDKLYASVRLDKEINGVKVISKGFYQTNEVEIIIYKSYDSLKSEGFKFQEGENED